MYKKGNDNKRMLPRITKGRRSMRKIVTTKNELLRAYKDNADVIIVKGELVPKLYKCRFFGKYAAGAAASLGTAVTAAALIPPIKSGKSEGLSDKNRKILRDAENAVEYAVIIFALTVGFGVMCGLSHCFDMDYKSDKILVIKRRKGD
jgi:hypothetical protein